MQAQFAGLSKEIQTAQRSADFPMNVQGYVNSLEAVNELRNGYHGLASDGTKVLVPGLNTLMQATGQINVSTVKAVDSTTKFTKALMDQKVGLGQVLGNFKKFRQELQAATTQQTALQKASAMQWTTANGKSGIDLYVPKDVTSELTSLNTKYGMINYAIGQIGTRTLNWGKNTQWAGRQITAGLSMPIAIASALLAKLSLDTDKQLTQIAKVYNTTTTAATGTALSQAQAEQQLSAVRTQSMQLATQMAQEYGAKLTDTLNIESQLAALGATGNNLYQSTAQVMRIATLGDLDYNTALQMTMTLMNAFHETGNDLANTFNFINAVENQTSLTTKDVAQALPRAGAAMASLGMNVKETVVLLTAFKEGGVEATQGANALKTAVARAFDPVPKAQKEFQQLGIDINSVVHDSGGDFLKFMEILSDKMQNLSGMQKETALKDLFGIQQSNRLLTVLNNLAEVTQNKIPAGFAQTATAFKLMTQSNSKNQAIAEQEIHQFQESASGQFKIAIASIQAELVKLGDPIMKALTPIIHVITGIIATFNKAPTAIKVFLAGLAVIATVAGPLIMLVGLFANLFGNAMRFGSAIGNLFLKFRPLTEAEAAERAIGRLATQTYNDEAQAVALLAQKMGELNVIMAEQIDIQKAAMGFTEATTSATAGLAGAQNTAASAARNMAVEEQAAASATAAAGGAAATTAATTRAIPNLPYTTLTPVGLNNRRRYGVPTPVPPSSLRAMQQTEMEAAGLIPVYTGTVQESVATRRSMFQRMFGRGSTSGVLQETNRLGNLPPVPPVIASGTARQVQQAEQGTKQMAQDAERTRIGFTRAVGALASVGMGVYAVKQMADGSGTLASNLMNGSIAMLSLVTLASTLNLKGMATSAVTWLKGLGTAGVEGAAATGGAWSRVGTTLKGGFAAIGNAAKWLFTTGPGIFIAGLTIAAAALYIIHQRITQASRDQEEINKSTDAWAQILGYTQNTAKALNDVNTKTANGITATQARQNAVNKLADANGALVDRLKDAANAQDNYNSLFNVAMTEAIKVKVNGGTTDQAQQAFEVALQAAGLKEYQIQQLDVRFNTIHLDNPEEVASQLMTDIQDALQKQGNKDTRGGNAAKIGPGFWDGEGIADDAKATAEQIGNEFNTALNAVANNPAQEQAVTQNFATQINTAFAGTFNTIRNKNKNLFKTFGINTIDDLNGQVEKALSAYTSGKASDNQKKLLEAVFGKPETGRGAQFGMFQGNDVSDSFKQYQEYFGDMVKAVGEAAGHSGDDLTKWAAGIHTVADLLPALGGPTKTIAQAQDMYNKALDDYKKKHGGAEMPQDLQLTALNAARATAGLGAATTVTQGFGDAAKNAGNAAQEAAGHFATMADAMKVDPSTMHLSDANQYINEMKSGYSGAIQTMTGIASTLMSRTEQAQQAGIQAAGDARQQALQNAQKQQDAAYDAQTKASQDALDTQKKQIEAHYKALGDQYDKQIKQAQDAAKAQTDGIQAQIDALNKEDQTRQKLFDNEKNRIQRLAQLQSNNIDFNSALNSGNLDAAAKVYSNNSATVQGWSLDDQQQAMDDASKAQQDALQNQIDHINNQTQAYVDAIQTKKDALSDLQQAEEDAADAAAQATQDQIAKQKQAYDDGMQAAQQADQKKTASALSSNQTMWQDKQVKLQMELSAITASIPQTDAQYKQQITDIEGLYAKYGVDLQGFAGAWGDNIGNALTYSMQTAAAGLQNDIGWSQIGQFVSDQLAANTGLTMDQVATYLRTGVWPQAQSQQSAKLWSPPPPPKSASYSGSNGAGIYVNGSLKGFHQGGLFSHSDRQGYPVNAGLFSSEYLTLLEQGEFVVNKRAAAQHGDLLNAINNGMIARHSGGAIGMTAGVKIDLLAQGAAAYAAALDAMRKQASRHSSGGYGPVGAAPTNVTGNKAIVQQTAANMFGWSGAEWNALYYLLMRESGFRNTAQNPTSTAYGMFQFLNSTWAGYGIPKTSDPYLQTVAGLRYIKARYRDPLGAAAHERAYNWYDNGGMLLPGMIGLNGTGKPEPVFTDEQWNIMSSLIANTTTMAQAMSKEAMGHGGFATESGTNYNVTIDMTGSTFEKDIDVEKAVYNALVKIDYKNGRSRTIG